METDLIISISIIFLLLLISGFFSGSETGLTGASRAKIYKLKNEGNRKAAKVLKLREDKENLIGAILFGNNVVNILATSISAGVMIELFGEDGVLYATAIMTALVLIFAEVLPKTFAIQNSEKVALTVSPIFIYLVRLLSPITRFVQFLVNLVLNLFASKED
ncbi:MAG: CNNM domain-containing protein, partial [Rickettsiales bacterium]|nr:CNNM domain-containing protein [Rickettsiales bacterium]